VTALSFVATWIVVDDSMAPIRSPLPGLVRGNGAQRMLDGTHPEGRRQTYSLVLANRPMRDALHTRADTVVLRDGPTALRDDEARGSPSLLSATVGGILYALWRDGTDTTDCLGHRRATGVTKDAAVGRSDGGRPRVH